MRLFFFFVLSIDFNCSSGGNLKLDEIIEIQYLAFLFIFLVHFNCFSAWVLFFKSNRRIKLSFYQKFDLVIFCLIFFRWNSDGSCYSGGDDVT